ncbi:MAG: serine/threonine protein kinase, partial [Planctomycetales bacterium]
MGKTVVVDAERYEDLIRRSGLVEKDQLDKVLAKLAKEEGGMPTDSRILAKKLMAAKLITNWQNDKLMQGRHRGFFLGKYKLLGHISKGGMSEVYLAEQVMLRRRVAIKIFPPELIEKSSYLARFHQESRAQAAMDHPNIVKAHDFGNEGKIHYLVMEYVDGKDLNQFVEKKGPLPFRLAARFISQAGEALQYAHDQGTIHRDIKPANLMLDRTGAIKLLDLGLARIMDGEEGSLTLKHNENTLGTADYLAPEQAVDSHHIDERVDIYSLGGTFYFLLTGHPPFAEGTPVQRMMMHMNDKPACVSESRPDAPPDLIAICDKMLEKKPEDRYSSA